MRVTLKFLDSEFLRFLGRMEFKSKRDCHRNWSFDLFGLACSFLKDYTTIILQSSSRHIYRWWTFIFGEMLARVVLGWVIIGRFESSYDFLRNVSYWREFHIKSSTGTCRDRRHEPTFLDTCTTEKTNWSQIACGGCHTVALTKEGKVYTWGCNSNGQLGHGDNTSRDMPTNVVSLEGLIIIKISCGYYHTAVVTDKGEIFTWCVW